MQIVKSIATLAPEVRQAEIAALLERLNASRTDKKLCRKLRRAIRARGHSISGRAKVPAYEAPIHTCAPRPADHKGRKAA